LRDLGWADNSLTCDSEGNCMLKDSLKKKKAAKAAEAPVAKPLSIKEQIAADMAAETGGKSIKDTVAEEIATETGGKAIKDKVADDIADAVEEATAALALDDDADAAVAAADPATP